jgi:hypothetical protein
LTPRFGSDTGFFSAAFGMSWNDDDQLQFGGVRCTV